MSKRRVWIVGAGKRVRETALPALLSLPERFEVAGILARSARELDAAGRSFAVRPLADVRREELRMGDLVYVAVGKDAVPAVLQALTRFEREVLELLIDTPVLKMKQLRHVPLLSGWSRESVAEDVVHLPWYETVHAAVGEVTRVTFDRSAYAYHGLAQAKALTGAARVLRARRTRTATGARREIELEDGASALVIEPRDYARGRVLAEGARGRVTDRLEPGESGVLLTPLVEDGLCVGFRAGDATTKLAPEESALTRGDASGASVTARMESMKRIGFRRLLVAVAAGHGAYPVQAGLDDMAVDWFLERFGRWSPTALTDVRRPFARRFWGALGG